MAAERGVETISFPAISTGVYGYPLQEAAEIAVAKVKKYLEGVTTSVREVTFVLFDRRAWKEYSLALQK
jgi:O-acetyl-ADP-ribose deacetylase (regulator of RNase III)